MGFVSNFFKKQSNGRKNLAAALTAFDETYKRERLKHKDFIGAIEGIVAAYTEKGADALSASPNLPDIHKKLFRIAKSMQEARQGLNSSQEHLFLESFNDILSYRNENESLVIFRVANELVRMLTECDMKEAPATLA